MSGSISIVTRATTYQSTVGAWLLCKTCTYIGLLAYIPFQSHHNVIDFLSMRNGHSITEGGKEVVMGRWRGSMLALLGMTFEMLLIKAIRGF